MFDSPALDVVIGLIFIFLLYSLLVTIIGEALSTILNIRGRILLKSVERMLTDDVKTRPGYSWLKIRWALLKSLFFLKGPDYRHSLVERFFKYPSIKYLAPHSMNKYPPYVSASNFSTALIEVIRKKGTASTIMEEVANGLHSPALARSPETKKHLEDLINKANGDVNVFKKSIELWFDETMDRATGWYKTNIQGIQWLIGFVIAVAFNVNTFKIVQVLAKDDDARENLVKMALDPKRNEAYKTVIETTKDTVIADTLYVNTLKTLQKDAESATNILGTGWGLRDSLTYASCPVDEATTLRELRQALSGNQDTSLVTFIEKFPSPIRVADSSMVLRAILSKIAEDLQTVDSITYTMGKGSNISDVVIHGQSPLPVSTKLVIVLGNLFTGFNFVGFFITALALSLGAPFWFDLLNKVSSIKSVGKNPDSGKDEAKEKSRAQEYPEKDISKNSLGHQLAEHVLKDPVKYAIAMHGTMLKSIPGVISVNKDFISTKLGEKTPCAEVSVLPSCAQDLIPTSLDTVYNGINLTIPVKITVTEIGKLHNNASPTGFGMPTLGIRNEYKPGNNANWGTVTGLVQLTGSKEHVILSCSHVLQGNNGDNTVESKKSRIFGDAAQDQHVGLLKFHYRSSAFDIGWVGTREWGRTINPGYLKQLESRKLTRPRIVTEDDATQELAVRMEGLVSGEVRGFLWNNCVEFDFYYGATRVRMFNLVKLTRRMPPHGNLSSLSVPGDSGSLVTDDNGTPIGIVIGGTSEFTYALKLSEVFDRFTDITFFKS
jgi:hypothetical protein